MKTAREYAEEWLRAETADDESPAEALACVIARAIADARREALEEAAQETDRFAESDYRGAILSNRIRALAEREMGK